MKDLYGPHGIVLLLILRPHSLRVTQSSFPCFRRGKKKKLGNDNNKSRTLFVLNRLEGPRQKKTKNMSLSRKKNPWSTNVGPQKNSFPSRILEKPRFQHQVVHIKIDWTNSLI